MIRIIVQGRGGQGAQTAGNLLAAAFHAEGRQVQCVATYGGARRGTPVSAFLRVDDRPIRLRCDIDLADAILCFDASLLAEPLLDRADARTLLVVNSARDGRELADELPGRRILAVDGLAISDRHGLGRVVNAALLGAIARAIGAPALPTLEATVAERAPRQADDNVAACRAGWHAVDARMAAERLG